MLHREDIVPGMIAAIQTFGQLLHWNPHIHSLISCGAFTPDGDFFELPEFDMDRLLLAWQEAVFSLVCCVSSSSTEIKITISGRCGVSGPDLRFRSRLACCLSPHPRGAGPVAAGRLSRDLDRAGDELSALRLGAP